MRRFMVLAAVAVFLTACDDSTGPDGGARVAIQFAGSPTASASPALLALGPTALGALAIDVVGSNGTLTLETAHVIVDEFELEWAEDAAGCDDEVVVLHEDDDACEEFEVGPSFVELAMDGGRVAAATATVPAGAYGSLEFEVEDLEDDEDDAEEAQAIAELLSEVHAEFPDWPREASLRVAGTFTPTGGEAQPFVAYFEAEIEVELEFDTPFVVTESDVSRTITVELSPAQWFTREDGTVLDLTAYDYGTTGQVVEFSFEMEHGFEGVEHDD